jgi:hypothetical protein
MEPEYLSRYSYRIWAGRPGCNSRRGQETFLYSTGSRRALGSTQPLIQWVPGALSPGDKVAGP